MRNLRLLLATCLTATTAVGGTAPQVTITAPGCVAAQANGRVTARVTAAGAPVDSVRVYFRAKGLVGDFYVKMRPGAGDSYWAVLPRPKESVNTVELRVVVKDAAGLETATPTQTETFGAGCPVPALDPDEQKYAANLVVGLPAGRQPAIPDGFLCDGIISEISDSGQLVTMSCNPGGMTPLAWVGVSAAAVGGAALIISAGGGGNGPVSSARPASGKP